MELIDRYFQAVRFWLPKNQKQDIIAELSEDIRSQVEDREPELGRKLNGPITWELPQFGMPTSSGSIPSRHSQSLPLCSPCWKE